MATLGDLVVNLTMNTSRFAGQAQRARATVASLVSSVTSIAAPITAALTFGSAVTAAREAAAAEAKLGAVLQATGYAAGLTASEIANLAAERQKLTNFEDDATVSAAAVLATFRDIKGQTFKDAIVSAQDLSAVMGQDLQASVLQVGKALNDPIAGVTALKKVGVSFTEQQREQIAELQKSGDVLGAQKIILEELANEVGGAAEAMADPLTIANNALGDVGETLGGAVLPVLRDLAKVVIDNKDSIAGLASVVGGFLARGIDFIARYGREILVLIGIYAAWRTAIRAAAMAQALLLTLSGPKGWAVLAAALAASTGILGEVAKKFDNVAEAAQKADPPINQFKQQLSDLGRGISSDNIDEYTAALMRAVDQIVGLNELEAFANGVFAGGGDEAAGQRGSIEELLEDFARAPAKVETVVASVQKLQEAIGRIRMAEFAGEIGEDLADKVVGRLQGEVRKLTGVADAVKKAEDETALVTGAKTSIDLEVDRAVALGASATHAKELRAALEGLESAKLGKSITEEFERIRNEIYLINGSLTESERHLNDLAKKGWTKPQIDAMRAQLQIRDDAKARKALEDQTRTPLEKFQQEIDRLTGLRSRGGISAELFGRGVQQAKDDLQSSLPRTGPTPGVAALQQGSREAFSAIQAAIRGEPGSDAKKTAKNTQDAVTVLSKANDKLASIDSRLANGAGIETFTIPGS